MRRKLLKKLKKKNFIFSLIYGKNMKNIYYQFFNVLYYVHSITIKHVKYINIVEKQKFPITKKEINLSSFMQNPFLSSLEFKKKTRKKRAMNFTAKHSWVSRNRERMLSYSKCVHKARWIREETNWKERSDASREWRPPLSRWLLIKRFALSSGFSCIPPHHPHPPTNHQMTALHRFLSW